MASMGRVDLDSAQQAQHISFFVAGSSLFFKDRQTFLSIARNHLILPLLSSQYLSLWLTAAAGADEQQVGGPLSLSSVLLQPRTGGAWAVERLLHGLWVA